MTFVLASASPRRAELLESAGFSFTVMPADVDETAFPGERPDDYARRVARAKAALVAAHVPAGTLILAADTVVVGANGRLMGKPLDAAEAASMLRDLSGTVHEVHTAVVLTRHSVSVDAVTTTRVRFMELTEAEIDWYLRSGEAFGKAGAYGIQGRAARFIDWIDGSWSNVVGLPISTVYNLFQRIGVTQGPAH
ncbi:MAG TPA: Maf family protein [Vicinamibacterales bacterium]|nr:Maf family protein [Vicinamibacterales bacterium]